MYKKLAKSGLNVIPDDELPDQPVPKPLLGLYLVGWGVALIICGISGAINLREYAGYSHCFLTSAPALAALFIPSGILIAYLTIFLLLIRRAIRNVDTNAQLSEGTQATENMDLELLEPNANPSGDRNSVHSTQTVSSDMEDPEHSQFTQWKGQIIMLILFLLSWSCAAAVTIKPFDSYIPFEETLFAVLYAVTTSSLGVFVLFFYGIVRNDVRSQWSRMRCWLEKRKNRCCRTRNVCDANTAIPTQPLVQNLLPSSLNSNSQATQALSDSNSVASSRNTNRSRVYNGSSKLADLPANRDTMSSVSTNAKTANLVVLHRQQYRSNNSVTTYTEPACVEMFYNPHQSGVARKFFKKQRKYTKKNNLGPRKQGDGGATSDGGSCISIPRPTAKINNSLERSILSSSAKVNNTNIHVEPNPINDIKNVNILSDSGGSVSEERNIPIRFVIGQENLIRSVKKINNDSARHGNSRDNVAALDAARGATPQSRKMTQDSDADVRTDEEWHLRNVSQQCSLEYSSEMDTITQMTSERSDHNLPEICESAAETPAPDEHFSRKRCPSVNEIDEIALDVEPPLSRADVSSRLYLSNSMYCLPSENERPLINSYCNSLNDIASIARHRREYSKRASLADAQSITISSNLCGRVPESRGSYDRSERSLFEINSLASDNNPCASTHAPETSYNCSLINVHCTSDLEENDSYAFDELSRLTHVDRNVTTASDSKDLETNFISSLRDIASIAGTRDISDLNSPSTTNATRASTKLNDAQQFEANEIYSGEPMSHLPVVKKETSV